MTAQRERVYWVASSVLPDRATLAKYRAAEHHRGRLHKRLFAFWLARQLSPADFPASVTAMTVEPYGPRVGRYVSDAETLPEQGFEEGDVIVLVHDEPGWAPEESAAMGRRFPATLPVDLPFDRATLDEVLAALQDRKPDGDLYHGSADADPPTDDDRATADPSAPGTDEPADG